MSTARYNAGVSAGKANATKTVNWTFSVECRGGYAYYYVYIQGTCVSQGWWTAICYADQTVGTQSTSGSTTV